MTNIPSYLLSKAGCEKRGICNGCEHSIRRNPATGRFFITMGHPGFNSPANNRAGYASIGKAEAAIHHYSSKSKR